MNTKIKIQSGFTLIEVMIVIAIVGILSAVAIPLYNDYTIRTKVAAGLNLINFVKTGVSESYATDDMAGVIAYKNDLANNSGLGIVTADRVLSAVVSSDAGQLGTITITFNTALIPPLVTGNILKLNPHINGVSLDNTTEPGTIQWACSGEDGSVAQASFTEAQLGTIKSKYLPHVCR